MATSQDRRKNTPGSDTATARALEVRLRQARRLRRDIESFCGKQAPPAAALRMELAGTQPLVAFGSMNLFARLLAALVEVNDAIAALLQHQLGGGEMNHSLPPVVIDRAFKALKAKLDRPITDLKMSRRLARCLRGEFDTRARCDYIGEIVRMTRDELLQTKQFGRKSLRELQVLLDEMGLSLGASIECWQRPPEE